MGYSILVGRPVGLGFEKADVGTYMGKVGFGLASDERIDGFDSIVVESNRIALARNQIAKAAIDGGYDLLLMIDPDMVPDCIPGAPTFLKSSLDWMLPQFDFTPAGQYRAPAFIIGAPYCGGWPKFDVQVWEHGGGVRPVIRYDRRRAAEMKGIGTVDAVGTGLLLMPVELVRSLSGPWFYDSYGSVDQLDLISTQDFSFCQHVRTSFGRVYCNWDCWAGHRQEYKVGKPGTDGLPMEMPHDQAH
jgi:hypothetical protein